LVGSLCRTQSPIEQIGGASRTDPVPCQQSRRIGSQGSFATGLYRRLEGEYSLSEITIDDTTHCELTGSLTVEAIADLNGTVTIDADNGVVAGKLHAEGAATINADIEMESTFEIKDKLDLNATDDTTDIPTKFAGDLDVLYDLTVTGSTALYDDVDFTLIANNGGDSGGSGSDDFDATVIIEGGEVEAQGSLDFEGETTIL
jgi:hypothetical protein